MEKPRLHINTNTMIQPGTEIKIVACKELADLRLLELVGRRAIITEDLTISERLQFGYMIRLLDGRFMNEEIWYIPKNSVCDA